MFNWFKPLSPIIPPPAGIARWKVAWRSSATCPEQVVWQDDQLSILQPVGSIGQPFALSPTQRFVVIGEAGFTNAKSLWQKLEMAPAPTASDLSLVAALWEKDGVQSCGDLMGLFAVVVWDRDRQILWLGRDPSGIRTLYYTTVGSSRWVAPTLKALALHHSHKLDPVALRDYLCCAFVPGARTMWSHVKEVRPATVVEFPKDDSYCYWPLQEQQVETTQSIEWHGARLRQLLQQVVQEALPAHEPVGVLLSGGLDSSAVTAIAAAVHSEPVHTFSIHFGADCPNELAFSELVAQHCHTRHHSLEITFAQMWAHLPETIAALDDPIGDPLTVPNLLVGRLARQFVSVILNGEGGDPCFGGPKNQPMLLHRLFNEMTQQNALEAYLLSFQKCAADLPQLLQPDLWQRVQSKPSVFTAELESTAHYLNQLMMLNIKFKGADQILTKVNNLTQAVGLTGRSPLFDQRVVALSMQIPPEYKVLGTQEKAVLKQAVADLLPNVILHRPKSGMMVPVQLGFREHWNRQAKALLLHKKAAIAPYLNQTLVRNWLNYQGDTWGRYGIKLWLLVTLELWLRANQGWP